MEDVDASNLNISNTSTKITNFELKKNSRSISFEGKNKGTKRERLSFIEEFEELNSHSSTDLDLGIITAKKVKCSTTHEASEATSSTSSSLKTKLQGKKRNYRPKMMESSSDEESNEPKTKEQCNNLEAGIVFGSSSQNSLNAEEANDDERKMSVDDSENAEVSSNQSPNEPSPASGTESVEESERRRNHLFDGFLDSDDEGDNVENVDNIEVTGAQQQRNEERANQRAKIDEKVKNQTNKIIDIKKPHHKWNTLTEITQRQYGSSCRKQAHTLFKNRYCDSLHAAQRLELMSKLEYHTGCVNGLGFNDSGELLASCSDDLQIAVWNWTLEKTHFTYSSGHRNNIFQCKFLPTSGNYLIASCARDGYVRLAELTPSGVCNETRKLARHTRSAHKLTTRTNYPYELMSAGEDAVVFNIDIREKEPEKIVLVKSTCGDKVPLHSIQSHPLNDNQFCVCGKDEYVRVYDRRIMSPFGPPVIKYCPNHLVESKPQPNITCAVYSNNGDAILASYSNEDIYLFDTNLSEGAEYIHRYSGHVSSSTIKGVNFFSPSSKYVISGSDCGNIFVWDRDSEAIVNFMKGDENGVVNVLEPHPHLPMLATSGLDNDVKVWIPSCEKVPELESLPQVLKSNLRQRLESGDDFDRESQMLMLLFQHLRRNRTFNRGPSGGAGGAAGASGADVDEEFDIVDSSDSSTNYNSDDSELHDEDDGVRCSTQ